jgi:hypothetical protein
VSDKFRGHDLPIVPRSCATQIAPPVLVLEPTLLLPGKLKRQFQKTAGERTKVSDLAPVRANCHRMLHRQDDPADILGLRSALNGLKV